MDVNSIKQSIEKAAKTAVSKSTELLEVTKLKISIADAESEIDRLMRDIGRTIYEAYSKNEEPNEDISETCLMIDAKYAEIEEKQARIIECKNMIACPNCGKGIEKGSDYCSKCGEKL